MVVHFILAHKIKVLGIRIAYSTLEERLFSLFDDVYLITNCQK